MLARHSRVAACVALLGLVAGCGASAAAQPPSTAAVTPAPTPAAATPTSTPASTPAATPTSTPSATPTATPAAPTPAAPKRATAKAATASRATATVDRATAAAIRQYTAETSGGKTKNLLHKIGNDPTLLRTLESGNLNATRAYVAKQFANVWYHWHVSRMRILQGSRIVTENGVPFVVAPSQMTLRGTGGRSLGTLQVSIQDEIGFVRLMHRSNPIDVVVRGQSASHVRTSLPAATNVQLPSQGSVTIAGQRYAVRSFHQTAWANEPVTVWILAKG
jgi:hypothetical protein